MKTMRYCDGFTLVEVLVALVIVSLVLAAALRATGMMTTSQQNLTSATLASWSADNHLAELRLERILPALGRIDVPCPQSDRMLICETTVSASANNAIRRVDVRVVLATEPEHVLAHRIAFISSLP